MTAVLDFAQEALRDSARVAEAVTTLATSLDARRASLETAEWRQWIESTARPHPVSSTLREDPFVRHSATRPRGYPGDAELLDFIYRSDNVQPRIAAASPLGRKLYQYTSATPAPEAVRLRSALAAAEVDRAAAQVSRPHVLSVACGHLREARLAQSVAAGTLGRFVGVDQDPRSLELVRQEYGALGVEAFEYSVKDLIRSGEALGRFDFIYVLGLYDYLSEQVGARLLQRLFAMVNPGGKLWIANFTGSAWTTGFMEAIMDWWLVYRSPQELLALADAVPPHAIASSDVFLDPTGNVAFLELVRA
jgi:extracellular factor (EF) 3-hydroxypalmitic acid methyl ester biosynthesis protein